MNRRNLIKTLAGGAAPLILPRRLFGAEAPSKLITVGCIGAAEASKMMLPQMREPWHI